MSATSSDFIERAEPDSAAVSRRVLFLGTHGQANVGDELLLDTFLGELGPDNHYAVNSYDPEATRTQLAGRFDVSVFDTADDRIGLLREVQRCDVVVFGGGNILKELYRSVGRFRYSTLLMVLGVVVLARSLRKPVALANIGIGPVESPVGRLLVRSVLSLAWLVSVRDRGSLELAQSLRCRPGKVRLVPDAVWSRTGSSLGVDRAEARPCPPERPLRVALNLNKDVDNPAEWTSFLERLADALELVANNRAIEVHALPMQCAFKSGTDLEVLEDFLGGLDVPVLVHEPSDHESVARIISHCDLVLSERLHAIVLAAILRTPVVPLPYDVKVRALARQLGLADRSFDVGASLDPEALAEAVEHLAACSVEEGQRLGACADELGAEARSDFAALRSWVARPTTSWDRPPR